MTMQTSTFSLAVVAGILATAACSGADDDHKPADDVWDVDKDGVPRFVASHHTELEKVQRISRFRSGEGHDYSDAFEHCRSMKHYFAFKPELDWSTVAIFAPVTGTLTRVEAESAGTKVEIQSEIHPAFRFVVFHVTPSSPLRVNDRILTGQRLGNHVGQQTFSDVAVIVNDPTRQGRMVSYFETMTDELFGAYVARGMHVRAEAIISKAERDASPLTCQGDAFADPGTIPNWVALD